MPAGISAARTGFVTGRIFITRLRAGFQNQPAACFHPVVPVSQSRNEETKMKSGDLSQFPHAGF
jgi:hypothetical protein